MDISAELKERFCKDCCIPIDIFTEPVFTSRLELYDKFYNTIERYNVFLKMIQEKYILYEFESSATITAKKSGKCSIRAQHETDSFNLLKYIGNKCDIDVKDENDYTKIQSIELSESEVYLSVGNKWQLTATVLPDTVSDDRIIWETSNKKVATVQSGIIQAKSKGDCIIKAISNKDNTKLANCTLHVTDKKPINNILLSIHTSELDVNQTKKLDVSIFPEDTTNPRLSWSSSNENVVRVNSFGRINTYNKGTAIIKVSSKEDTSVYDECKIIVRDPVNIRNVVLNNHSIVMNLGEICTLKYTIEPEAATNKKVRWSYLNGQPWNDIDSEISEYNCDNVVKIHRDTGQITAIGKGVTSIRITCQGDNSITDTCKITVMPSFNSINSLRLDILKKELSIEESFVLTSTIRVMHDVDPSIKWVLSDKSILSIEPSESKPLFKSAIVCAEDYYNDYNNVKCNIVNHIKRANGYRQFCDESLNNWAFECMCMPTNGYTKDLDGHIMIKIQILQSLFSALYYYDTSIFIDSINSVGGKDYHRVWEDAVATIGETDNYHIIYSENLLNEVMDCCDRARIEVYSAYLLNKFYVNDILPLITNSDYKNKVNLVYFGRDTLILDVTDLNDIIDKDKVTWDTIKLFSNDLMKIYRDILQKCSQYLCRHKHLSSTKETSVELPLKSTLFTLHKLKSESVDGNEEIIYNDIDGYVENIYYGGNQTLEFVEIDSCQLPMLMRSMSYQSIQEEDRKFMHKGLMAQFTDDFKISAPSVSSIIDVPKNSESE